jgi:hypothetical protein
MAKNWDTPKKQEAKANSLMAPDKGDVFDKVHACEEATKLAERSYVTCRRHLLATHLI